MLAQRGHLHCGPLMLRLLLLLNALQLSTQERPAASSADDVQLAVGNRGTAVVQPRKSHSVSHPGLEYSKTSEGISAIERSVHGVYQWAERNLDAAADKSLEKSAVAGLHVQDLGNGMTNYRNSVKTYRKRLKELHDVEMAEVKDDMTRAQAEHIRNAMIKEAPKSRISADVSEDDSGDAGTSRDGPGKAGDGQNDSEGAGKAGHGQEDSEGGSTSRDGPEEAGPGADSEVDSEGHGKAGDGQDESEGGSTSRDGPGKAVPGKAKVGPKFEEGDAVVVNGWHKGTIMAGPDARARYLVSLPDGKRKMINEKLISSEEDVQRHEAVDIGHMQHGDRDPCVVETYKDKISWKPWAKPTCNTLINRYIYEGDASKEFKFDKGSDDQKKPTFYKIRGQCHQVRFYDNDYFKFTRKDVDVFGTNDEKCTKFKSDLRRDLKGVKIWAIPQVDPCTVKMYRDDGCTDIVNSYTPATGKLPEKFKFKPGSTTDGTHYTVSEACQRVRFFEKDFKSFRKDIDIHGKADCTKLPLEAQHDLGGIKVWPKLRAPKVGKDDGGGGATFYIDPEVARQHDVGGEKASEGEDIAAPPQEHECAASGLCSTSIPCPSGEVRLSIGPKDPNGANARERCCEATHCVKDENAAVSLDHGTKFDTSQVNTLAECQVETYRSKDCTDIIKTYRRGNKKRTKSFVFGKGSAEKKAYWYKIEGDCGRVEFVDDHFKIWAKNMHVNGAQECTKFSFRLKNDLGGINIGPPTLGLNQGGASNADDPTQVNPECVASTYSDSSCSDEVKSYKGSEMVTEFLFPKGGYEENKPTHYKLSGQCLKVEFYDAHAVLYKSNHKAYDSQGCSKLPWGLRHDLGGLKMWVKQQQGGWKDGAYGAHAFGGHPR